jgi:hypothetical protein
MRSKALTVALAASTLLLAGCATVDADDTRGDDRAPRVDDLDNRTDVSCTPGEELLLNAPSTLYTVSGPCESLTIEGNGLIVHTEEVDTLVLRGDGNLIEAVSIGSLEVSGQDNTVRADSIDDATINGERNSVED